MARHLGMIAGDTQALPGRTSGQPCIASGVVDELLQSLWSPRATADTTRRQSPAPCLQPVSSGALPESANRRRLPAGLAAPGAAVQARHCAAPGLLDTPCRVHGK